MPEQMFDKGFEAGEIKATLRVHERDIRALAPLAYAMPVLEAGQKDLKEDVNGMGKKLREVRVEFEKRLHDQEEKHGTDMELLRTRLDEAEDKRKSRTVVVWVACLGLIGTFITSTGVVLASVL